MLIFSYGVQKSTYLHTETRIDKWGNIDHQLNNCYIHFVHVSLGLHNRALHSESLWWWLRWESKFRFSIQRSCSFHQSCGFEKIYSKRTISFHSLTIKSSLWNMKIELGCVNEHMARGMKIDGSLQFHHQPPMFLDRNPLESWSILWEMAVLCYETSQLIHTDVNFC